MPSGRAALTGVLTQLERGERDVTASENDAVCAIIKDCGEGWPQETSPEDASIVDRLVQQLPKFTVSQRRRVVGCFRPLRDHVRWSLSEIANGLNKWLSEARAGEKSAAGKLGTIFQSLTNSFLLDCYGQCTDVAIKAQFLMAIASVLCAVHAGAAPLRSVVAGEPRVSTLGQKIVDGLFVLPRHGNVLPAWHCQRLDRYNRTFWRAGRRAADRLRDDLQVRLVSALRRATAPVQLTGGKAKPQLQVELRAWPMVGCPLAKSFLEFVAQRDQELGDLGSPALAECPPNCLRPETLKRLLTRLEAFELSQPEAGTGGSAPLSIGTVRLRWEAVAALAFKAVGTKPKAAAATPAAPAVPQPKAAPGSERAERPKNGQADATRGADHAHAEDARKAATPDAKRQRAALREPGSLDADTFTRLIRRGLRANDADWIAEWSHFCKSRRASTDLAAGSHPKELLADFCRRSWQSLAKKDWAADLVYAAPANGDGESSASEAEASDAGGPRSPAGGSGKKAAAAKVANGSAASIDAEKQLVDGTGSESSYSRSKHRKRAKRDRKRSYKDFYGHGKKVAREVMMMNQMMGMSMMMRSPLAMMGLRSPMMAQMAAAAKAASGDGASSASRRSQQLAHPAARPEKKAKRESSDHKSSREHAANPLQLRELASAGGDRKRMIDKNDL